MSRRVEKFLLEHFTTFAKVVTPSPRIVTVPCKPARRFFDFLVNGDTGDEVLDGVEPAQNPSLSLYATSNELTGLYLHSASVAMRPRP